MHSKYQRRYPWNLFTFTCLVVLTKCLHHSSAPRQCTTTHDGFKTVARRTNNLQQTNNIHAYFFLLCYHRICVVIDVVTTKTWWLYPRQNIVRSNVTKAYAMNNYMHFAYILHSNSVRFIIYLEPLKRYNYVYIYKYNELQSSIRLTF